VVVGVADEFHAPLRPVLDKPLRLCVTDVFKAVGAGVAVAGMIHTGSVQAGDRIVAVPAGETAIVKGLLALCSIFCIIILFKKCRNHPENCKQPKLANLSKGRILI